MRAMILNNPRVLEPGNVDKPATEDGNALVHIANSGICGTDLEIYSGGIPVNYPRIMGHEMIGEIAETAAPGVAVGARVIVDPVMACGTCYQCRAGQSNLCPSGGLIGRDRDGGFAEFTTVPADQARLVDTDKTDIELATFCCAYMTGEHMLEPRSVPVSVSLLRELQAVSALL